MSNNYWTHRCKRYDDKDCKYKIDTKYVCPAAKYNMIKGKGFYPCYLGKIRFDWIDYIKFKHILEEEFIEL